MRIQPLVAVPVLAFALAGSLLAQEAERKAPVRKVTVTGTAVTRVAPDLIVWHLSTTDQSKNLLEAKQASDVKLRALLGLEEALKIDAKDIQTGHLSIEREYERSRHGNVRTFKQFAVTRHVTVKQRDLERFDEFLAKFVGAAEVEINFSLESTRIAELRMQTRYEAVRVARTKASAMAEALGAKLGRVMVIAERKVDSPYASNRFFNTAVNVRGEGRPDSQTGTFAPGAIEVRISVEVAFELQ